MRQRQAQAAVLNFFRQFGVVCAIIGIGLLVLSYCGAVHPLGDSLAVFRLWLAGGVALGGGILFVFKARLIAIFGISAFRPALMPLPSSHSPASSSA